MNYNSVSNTIQSVINNIQNKINSLKTDFECPDHLKQELRINDNQFKNEHLNNVSLDNLYFGSG